MEMTGDFFWCPSEVEVGAMKEPCQRICFFLGLGAALVQGLSIDDYDRRLNDSQGILQTCARHQ